jgi:hypothetical protein
MSKMNTEKKLVSGKLVLKREALRTLSAQTLEEVVGGITTNSYSYSCL